MKIEPDVCSTPAGAAFRTTHWSLVLRARDKGDSQTEDALAALCQTYWYPVYAFIRRKGHNPPEAQDLAQEFFYRLIGKEYLRNVDREKGRFRTFLLTAVQRFLCNEWERSQAQKRGGGAVFVTWDANVAEERYCQEPSHHATPEKLFERRWALTVLEHTMRELKSEYERAGKGNLFAVLQDFIVGDADESTYSEAGQALELSPGAARVWAHRIRRRYGELLRERIAETVDSDADLEDELRNLHLALGA